MFADAGIRVPPALMLETDFTHEAGLKAGRRLLAEDPPRAIFCASDIVAFGVIDAAKERGLRVPEDLWVVGYDDIPMSSWKVLDLTTTRQPVDEMARRSLQMLLGTSKTPTRTSNTNASRSN